MSNIKEIKITGKIPFHCYEDRDMVYYLGQMNCPTMGIKINYPLGENNIEYRPNEHGGKTTYYYFIISGQEAVSDVWIQKLQHAIFACGGEIESIFVKDVENNQILIDKQP